MTDLLYYEVGYSFIGNLIEKILVKKRVHYIFDYREIKLQELFKDSQQCSGFISLVIKSSIASCGFLSLNKTS